MTISPITVKHISDFPYIEWVSESRCILRKPFYIVVERDSKEYKIFVPNDNLEYDGLTYKKITALLQIEEGRSTPAWLIHDHLLLSQDDTFSRKEKDIIFRELLKYLGYGPKRANIAYSLIRLYVFLFNK